MDDARSALEQAVNRQAIAQSQLGVTEARVAQARAAVAQAQAAVDRSEEELTNATIRSPIAGVVLSRDVEVGSPVSSILNLGSSATLVMVLGDISQVYVKGKVDEADIGLVRMAQPARIRVETFKDRQFEGRVTQIAPMGVERDNVVNFEVRVSIDNSSGELRANMTSNAEIVLEEHKGTLVIPERAVIYDASRRTFAERVQPASKTGRERVPISVGISNGTRTEVTQGTGRRRPGRPPVGSAEAAMELLRQTWSNLAANKLRSFLTMFGIMWGVISIVLLSAVGEGFQRGNQYVLEELGKNIVIIRNGRTAMQAGGARAGRLIQLDIEDVRLLKEQSKLLAEVSPELMRGGIRAKSAVQLQLAAAERRLAGLPVDAHDRGRSRPADLRGRLPRGPARRRHRDRGQPPAVRRARPRRVARSA